MTNKMSEFGYGRKRRNSMELYGGYSCDKCRCAFMYMYEPKGGEWLPTKTYLVNLARKKGWSIGKRVLCPECRKARKSDEQ